LRRFDAHAAVERFGGAVTRRILSGAIDLHDDFLLIRTWVRPAAGVRHAPGAAPPRCPTVPAG
jgi:hypothetical protein